NRNLPLPGRVLLVRLEFAWHISSELPGDPDRLAPLIRGDVSAQLLAEASGCRVPAGSRPDAMSQVLGGRGRESTGSAGLKRRRYQDTQNNPKHGHLFLP